MKNAKLSFREFKMPHYTTGKFTNKNKPSFLDRRLILKSPFYNMKKTIQIFLLSFLIPLAMTYGQVENPHLNYTVTATKGLWLIDGDPGGICGEDVCHDEEIVFKIAVCPDDDQQPTQLTPTGNVNPSSTPCGEQFECFTKRIDCQNTCTFDIKPFIGSYSIVFEGVNELTNGYDIDWRAYEDDGPNNFDCHGVNTQHNDEKDTLVLLNGLSSPKFVNEHVFEGVNEKFFGYWEDEWRYTFGRRMSNNFGTEGPLKFGTLVNETVSHVNSTEFEMFKPSNEKLAYQDDWMATPGPDITYTFSIGQIAQEVDISMSITQGNFTNHKMIIYRENDNNTIDQLYEGTGAMLSHTVQLCEGNYIIVIEGNHAPTNVTNNGVRVYAFGDKKDWFNLSIDASNISSLQEAGTISHASSTGSSTACIGFSIGKIENDDTADDIAGNTPTYQWEKSENGGPWQDVFGGTQIELSDAGNMGNDQIRFRRKATVCGVQGFSNTVTINPVSGSITTNGTIELSINNTVIPVGTDPGALNNVMPAAGTPGPISYRWELCLDCNVQMEWFPAPGDNININYDIPILNDAAEHSYRRVAINACGGEAPSNVVVIDVLEPNGTISGKVTSPSNINGAGSGVGEVEIEIKRITGVPGGNLTTDTYTTTTNSQGEYIVPLIYYGIEAMFTVTPSKTDNDMDNDPNNDIPHEFDPVETTITLSTLFPEKDMVDFIDETTFTVSGNIFQDFNAICGMDTVGIKLGPIVIDSTDANGDYSIAVPGTGTYTIEPIFKDHIFTPSSWTGFISNDLSDIDFENEETQRLEGFVGGSCQSSAFIGQAELRFTDEDLCISEVISTNGSGNYLVDLPARPYRVQVIGIDNPRELEIKAFFQNSVLIDLTETDMLQNFIYQPFPTIEVSGFPEDVCNRTILEQLVPVELTIDVVEELTGCPVDTGTVIIADNISDLANTTIELPITNGQVVYTVIPGAPNLTAPNLKSLTITAKDTLGQSVVYTKNVLVTGGRPRNSTFTTVTPEIPIMILHDPPGDASYAFVEANETMETTTSFYHEKAGSVNTWAAAKVGASFTVGVGFEVENEVYAELTGGLTVGGANTSSEEITTSISTTELFSTSGNDDIVGAKGDVFIGGAMNLIYANTDVIDFDAATCSVVSSVELMIAPDGFETEYIYTEQHIAEFLIPDLLALAANQSNPDSVLFFLNQANVWEQALLRNEELKANAVPSNPFQGNVSFSAGTVKDLTVTAERSSTLSWEFNVEVESEVAFAAGIESAGAGLEGGVTVGLRTDFGESESQTTTSSLTTGFHLEDGDIGDSYSVDILTDPVYQTPVFALRAAETSCPYEESTLQRDVPVLAVDQAIEVDVDPVGQAEFTLLLRNESESEETRDYKLSVINSSINGAELLIGGFPLPDWGPEPINFGGETEVIVKVGRGSTGIFSYENLLFRLYADCDPSIADTIAISAFFESECSDISMFEPNPNWVLNESSNKIDVHLKDYDKALMDPMDQIKIQIAETGTTPWTTAATLTKADLNNNNPGGSNLGDITPIFLTNLDEGDYDIRVELVCSQGTIFSNRSSGKIDRTAPSLFGTPTPINDEYVQGETPIQANFDQSIDCGEVSVTLENISTATSYTIQYQCSGSEMIFLPNETLPDGTYAITVTDIEDINDNRSEPITWFFNVGEVIEDDCGPLLIDNNNTGQSAIESGSYYGSTISSFGQVVNNNDVEMIGEISVMLDPDFEVRQGSQYLADIGDCDDAPDQNAPCQNAIPVTLGIPYFGDTNFGTTNATGVSCGQGDAGNFSNWYVLSGDDRLVSLSICDNAGFDAVIEVFTGTCGQELSCVTDNSAVNTVGGCTASVGEAIFMADLGVEYFIRVMGNTGQDPDRYTLFVDFRCPSATSSLKSRNCSIIYVNHTATTGMNNGTSWEDAFVYLQDAIAAQTSGSGSEIWVAKGIYYPDLGTNVAENDRSASFSGGSVSIYGGFNGTELPGFDKFDRDLTNNVTILSGDIGLRGDMSDNSYHVVTDCSINGVTVTKGNADGPAANFEHVGGGLYRTSGSSIISQCTFIDNHATIGGGIYSNPSFLTEIWNCVFVSNTAEKGGGAYIQEGIFSVFNSTFSGNVATNTDPSISDNASALAFGSGVFFGSTESSIFWGNGLVADDDIKDFAIINCIVEIEDENATASGQDNINEDPLFIDQPDLEDPIADLRLQAGSPAIDVLIDQEIFTIDVENISRPQGNWDDIGAYEYVFPNN